MLEIIVLIFLAKDIGKLAISKGVKPSTWKIYTVFGWIISEIFGFIVGIMIFGEENLVSIILVGLIFAITSFYIIKTRLNKLPDHGLDDDINNIGQKY
ncbi:MAG: hypothetical protein ABI261_09480 [Ginsengibacter sp.]